MTTATQSAPHTFAELERKFFEQHGAKPANAFLFDAAPADIVPETTAADEPPRGKIKMLARTAQPIAHWFWGKIAHDMSGCRHRDRIPVDFCHYGYESIGFVDQFLADNAVGLQVAGELVAFKPDDKAAEILFKGKAGIPYQASIDWTGPARIEEVPAGFTSEVNGYTFEGPGYIVREWTLAAMAVCPHGADSGTLTEFNKKRKPGDVAAADQSVTIFSKQGGRMSGSQQQGAAAAAEARAELAKFTKVFGGEAGAKFFSEGTEFAAALESHVSTLATQLSEQAKQHTAAIAAKDTEIAELKTKLSQVTLGEKEGTQFSGDDKPKKKFADVFRIRSAAAKPAAK